MGREVDDEKRLVVPLEDIFETIYIVHVAKRFHQGINTTLDQLQAKFNGVIFSMCESHRPIFI